MKTTLYSINFETGKMEPIDESQGDKNNLPVGTILHLNGYNDPDYLILKNLGVNEKSPAYGADYECISLENGNKIREQAYCLKWTGEKKDNRIQVYITDRIMNAEEMRIAIAKATQVRGGLDREANEKKEIKEREIKELPSKYPYLTPGSNGAKNLKIELKRAFPSIKFSVVTEHYSSINVNWTDGPTVEEVEKVSGKYQKGNFDGMNDIYEYNHDNVFPEVFGGAQYVFENRHESTALVLGVASKMGFNLTEEQLEGLEWETRQSIYREARKTRV